MEEQINLFYMEESYDLGKLKQFCVEYVRKKYPKPVEGEDYQEYQEFIRDEADLMFVEKMRQEADKIERRILGPQTKIIQVAQKNKPNY